MSHFETIYDAWRDGVAQLHRTRWFARLLAGDVTREHYRASMRETYHQAGVNPQIMAALPMHFRDKPRDMVRLLLEHAAAEVGHDLLVKHDLKVLGEDVSQLDRLRPLPGTAALTAFPLYQMQYGSPLAYFGYIFHLEFMATHSLPRYMEQLRRVGVPDQALTAFKLHAEVDQEHAENIRRYIGWFVRTTRDLDDVIYAARTTCVLQGRMISDAFDSVEGASLHAAG